MEQSLKAETPEAKPPSKKKRPSGKSNWKSINQQRKDRAMAAARHKQGLPVRRLRSKQTIVSRRSGRVIQRAIRMEDSALQCSVGTQTMQSFAPDEIVQFCRVVPSTAAHAPSSITAEAAERGIYVAQCLPTGVYSPERAASARISEAERAASASPCPAGEQARDERGLSAG